MKRIGAVERAGRLAVLAAGVAGLAYFYYLYVPLHGPFQAVFAPLLAATTIAAAIDRRWGSLVFLALLAPINSLPYFFGIYENRMHAPAALVLFLCFGIGLLARWGLSGGSGKSRPSTLPSHIRIPLALWAAIAFFSALIAILRYANFFFFAGPGFLDLPVNTIGGRAGGAVMAVVMGGLIHLTGIAAFLIDHAAAAGSPF